MLERAAGLEKRGFVCFFEAVEMKQCNVQIEWFVCKEKELILGAIKYRYYWFFSELELKIMNYIKL